MESKMRSQNECFVILLLCLASAYCIPSCPNPDPLDHVVFFPHESDCNLFYRCDHGAPLLEHCPAELHWNPTLDTCDWPWNAGCSPNGGGGGNNCGGNEDDCPNGEAPKCPAHDPAHSVFFPHPNDCHWFFHCSNGVVYCKICPSGLHWNAHLQTCDWPWHAGCSGHGKPPGTKPPGTKPPSSNGCPVPQPIEDIFFPDPYDCTIFYQCSFGVVYEKKCPEGLHFNPEINRCDYPENAGCNHDPAPVTTQAPAPVTTQAPATNEPENPGTTCPSATPPDCPNSNPGESVYFPHPTDSHWFFHCSDGIAYCKVCPAGLNWNQDKQQCDW